MPVTVADFAELTRLTDPQLRVLAAQEGISKRTRRQKTADGLRLSILWKRSRR